MIRPIVEIIALAFILWLEGLWPLFEGRRNRLKHALPNLGVGILNGLLIVLVFSSITVHVMSWTVESSFGLLNQIHGTAAAKSLLAFLLFDFWMYGWHMANHKVPFLWRFHRMHHSDLELDSTSALRFHPGEIIFSSLLRLAIIPLIGINFTQLLIYEICLQPVILFHHSNVALPEKIDRIFRAVIVTPNMHRVHHSQIQAETDSNYSSIFSFWDRIGRTFRKREDPRALVYGLPYFQETRWQTLSGLIKTPFVNISNPGRST